MPFKASQSFQSSILVVDDDPDICMALTDLFGEQGHEVAAVGTGTEAVKQVTRHHYDVVLLDVGLPDIDGLTVLSTITELNDDPRVRFRPGDSTGIDIKFIRSVLPGTPPT